MFWHEESTKDDVVTRLKGGFDPSIGGTASNEEHWYVLAQSSKEDPVKRFEHSVKGLPMPRAFTEAALGLRAIIKADVANNRSYEGNLKELYTLAVWQSYSMKRSEKADTVGHNILERIPGGLIANINCDYQDIGYKHLELINKTDAKRLVAIWGEPKSHTTLLEYDDSLWRKYEDEFIEVIKNKGYTGIYDFINF